MLDMFRIVPHPDGLAVEWSWQGTWHEGTSGTAKEIDRVASDLVRDGLECISDCRKVAAA